MVNKNLISVILSICITQFVWGQGTYKVTGMVRDEKGLPLPGATIFIENTKHLTASDTSGHFTLAGIAAGTYQLIVKSLGYRILQEPVTLTDKDFEIGLALEVDVQQLAGVTVRPDKSWFKNLAVFKKEFIGETENAKECKILNPDILNFQYDKKAKVLTATGTDELKIENRALGYQLTYHLKTFKYNENTGAVYYDGFVYFEDLKGDSEETLKWHQNQSITYGGSMLHLIRSIYKGNTSTEGFALFRLKFWRPSNYKLTSNKSELDIAPYKFDAALIETGSNLKQFFTKDAVCVIYTKAAEDDLYTSRSYSLSKIFNDSHLPSGEFSVVNINGPVLISSNGTFKPVGALYFEGYMGWQKIADLLPFDYASQ